MLIQLGTLKKGHKFSTPTVSGNYLNKFYDFKIKTPFEYFYAKTFFVVKGGIINDFISKCDESFFNDYLNIYGEKNTDRYFFERDFLRLDCFIGTFKKIPKFILTTYVRKVITNKP